MKICTIENCKNLHYCLGMCRLHYRRFDYYRKRGTTKKEWPEFCQAENCCKKAVLKGFCNAHYLQKRRKGDPNAIKKRKSNGSGHVNNGGYKKIYVNKVPKWEHRYVMEQKIGRDLLKTESVHHKNGDRLDNRIENLELWSKSQPAGQRVEDKCQWAIEILKIYKPDLLK